MKSWSGIAGLYYTAVVLTTLVFGYAAFVCLFTWQMDMRPLDPWTFAAVQMMGWWGVSLLASGIFVGWRFRKLIVEADSFWQDLQAAFAVLCVSICLFSFLATLFFMPPVGLGYGFVTGILMMPVLMPMALLGHYILRWADRHDEKPHRKQAVSR